MRVFGKAGIVWPQAPVFQSGKDRRCRVMKIPLLSRVLALVGLLVVMSPSGVRAETWAYAWSQGGESDTRSRESKKACENDRAQFLHAMRALGESARAGPCQRVGGASSAPSQRSSTPAARPKPPSGPTAAERQRLMESRQRENERAVRNARQRDLARQRKFESDKAALLEDLYGSDVEVIAAQNIASIDSPAMRQLQLICSASRAHRAISLYDAGDYQTAIRLSRASIGKAQSAGKCTVAGFDIPDVAEPEAEIDFKAGIKRFQEVEVEITETIIVLATAQMDMKKAKETTKRRETQVERQKALVARLENAPEGEGKEEGLDKANDLVAKARAMLAKAIAAEDAADERLRGLDGKRERLCAMSNDLSETLNKEKAPCLEEENRG